jgi:phospholipid:diacylglycerol acyltransferase
MMDVILRNPSCWKDHMMLDLNTGMDPKNIKLRPAAGLEAADYLFPGYWVWGRMIENLGDLGYDSNNIHMASYDWRLAFANLENRDAYFTKLRHSIEILKQTNGNKKVVILTHSMGSLVYIYFMKWAEHNISPDWVNNHIHSYVNIGGPLLGVSKSLSTILSGEMKDTSQFYAFQAYFVDNMISPMDRLKMARSWGSIMSMLPKGGDPIWGTNEQATDDSDDDHRIDGRLGRFISIKTLEKWENSSISNAVNTLFKLLDDSDEDRNISTNYKNWYSYGHYNKEFVHTGKEESKINGTNYTFLRQDQKYWSNPLESPLPFAPNMKIYCLYGVGKETERGYIYSYDKNGKIPYSIQTKYSNLKEKIQSGVRIGEGDGTVPLISLGYMCVQGWKDEKLNPSKIPVTTREYKHSPTNSYFQIRSGPSTGDHVDIMGNNELIRDIISIVTGQNEDLENRIESNIVSYSKKVKFP